MAVVLGVALAVGGGLLSGGRETDAQRAAAIDAQLRCPSCIDATVEDSSASAAVAVRHEVAQLVAEGRTDTEIDAALVSRYGETILLRPPTSGLAALVWVIPSVAGAAAAAGIGALFWRRSRELGRLRREGP
jgi:cytochrome c-type biogenesis protein CcmH